VKAELPDSELVTLKPSGHMGLMEQNQWFAEAVSAFSAACSSTQTLPKAEYRSLEGQR